MYVNVGKYTGCGGCKRMSPSVMGRLSAIVSERKERKKNGRFRECKDRNKWRRF